MVFNKILIDNLHTLHVAFDLSFPTLSKKTIYK